MYFPRTNKAARTPGGVRGGAVGLRRAELLECLPACRQAGAVASGALGAGHAHRTGAPTRSAGDSRPYKGRGCSVRRPRRTTAWYTDPKRRARPPHSKCGARRWGGQSGRGTSRLPTGRCRTLQSPDFRFIAPVMTNPGWRRRYLPRRLSARWPAVFPGWRPLPPDRVLGPRSEQSVGVQPSLQRRDLQASRLETGGGWGGKGESGTVPR